jgi:NAD(P)-dependent dehydrogenase (short-subunit alcohol dehydrogenase family)
MWTSTGLRSKIRAGLQTDLQTNHAAQYGTHRYKLRFSHGKCQTRASD